MVNVAVLLEVEKKFKADRLDDSPLPRQQGSGGWGVVQHKPTRFRDSERTQLGNSVYGRCSPPISLSEYVLRLPTAPRIAIGLSLAQWV